MYLWSLYMYNMPRPTDTSSLNIMIVICTVKQRQQFGKKIDMNYEAPVCFSFVSLRYRVSNTELPSLI
jgi:hypothetical protein